ncbi:MAG: hypothetical protein VYE81_08610 [Planctomycetota bacterium]|nr:hypothetical protein [Planctomycetota bacterium]
MNHNADCHGFRRGLERALSGRPVPAGLRELSWHEHLLGCGECRELLEREEALEELLATLPTPRLSPELARRVLERLREVRRGLGDLDELLALVAGAEAPGGLAHRVLIALEEERTPTVDERLDALLARDPAPQIPHGLSERLLSGLAPALMEARADERLDALLARDPDPLVPAGLAEGVLDAREDQRFPLPTPFVLRLATSRWAYAAAAGLLIAAFGLWRPGADAPTADHLALSEPPPGMLDLFDVLSEDLLFEDELLEGEDGLEVDLSLSLGAREEVLMDYEFPEGPSEEEGG